MNDQAVAQLQQSRGEVEFIPFGADSKIKLSVKIIKDFVAIPTKSGKLPDDRDCMKFMMLCRARKLNPFEGDCFLQGYDGHNGAQFSLITAHQAFLKRAEVNPEFDGMISGVIVKNDNDEIIDRKGDFLFPNDALLGAWAIVLFKTRRTPTERRLNLATFNQGFGRWQKDPAGMIVKCAEADALRSSFPTMLGGLYSEQEMTAVIDVGPSAKSPDFGPSDGSPKRKAIMQAKTAEQPAKTSQDASAPIASQSEPPASGNAAPAPSAEQGSGQSEVTEQSHDGDLGPKTPFVPRPNSTEALNNLLYVMFQNEVSEGSTIAYCKENKLMKLEQTDLGQLSDAKLVTLAKAFPNILAALKR